MSESPVYQPEDMLPDYCLSTRRGVRGKYRLDPNDWVVVEITEADGHVSRYRYLAATGEQIRLADLPSKQDAQE